MIVQKFQDNVVSNLYALNEAAKVAYFWTPAASQALSYENLMHQSCQYEARSLGRSLWRGAAKAQKTLCVGGLDFLFGSGPVLPQANALLRNPRSGNAWSQYFSEVSQPLRSTLDTPMPEKRAALKKEISAGFENFSQMGCLGAVLTGLTVCIAIEISFVQTAVELGVDYVAKQYHDEESEAEVARARSFSSMVIGACVAKLFVDGSAALVLTLAAARLASHTVSAVGVLCGSVFFLERAV